MNRADEGALCWALVDDATAFLKPSVRTRLCAKIVAGEQGSAITDLLAFYANSDAELPWELAVQVQVWIHGFAGSEREPILRRIYDGISVSNKNYAYSPAEVHRSPRRLTARRSAHAARPKTAAQRPTYGMERVAVCGITTSVDGLVDAALEARGLAQKAIEVAVREARSLDWSWAQISAALGGVPNEDTLRRKFGSDEGTRRRDSTR